ncbi:MAG: NAD(P)H-dependent oxidoreductase [Cryobacterium sp.]|nr:NAD(P)H-dependent oxidoreductase [Oligoflexia bacterium]
MLRAPSQALILLAHPTYAESKLNRALLNSVAGNLDIKVRDLASLYPDFKIDVAAEQKALIEADLIVFQFPLFWYSTPAILKKWQDEVLTWGFAFGKMGKALHGKKFLVATTTGVDETFYLPSDNRPYDMEDYLSPLIQTARYCGLEPLPCFCLYGGRNLPENRIAEAAAAYRKILIDTLKNADQRS